MSSLRISADEQAAFIAKLYRGELPFRPEVVATVKKIAELMRRVFAVDVLECPRCHGPMKILAAIHPPDTAGAILECLGLSARPPPAAPARRVAARLFDPAPDWSDD